MVAKIPAAALFGLSVLEVSVEVDLSNGLPGLTIVGLPDKSVEESRERVRSAIRASSATLPMQRITVNLSPADIKKEGPAFDVPMALGILLAAKQIPDLPGQALFLGELSLDGSVQPVRGVFPMAAAAGRQGYRALFVPKTNAPEASLVEGVTVFAVASLRQLIDHLKGEQPLVPYTRKESAATRARPVFDFAQVKGQASAKRALAVAAAGGHNVLLVGPPGTGKTMLARALPGILPPLSKQEVLELTAIYSVAGLLSAGDPLLSQRPFRSPHHSISLAGLIGGGTWPRPGEMSLAHRGVLFLDEIPQFASNVLEAIRGPLEDRRVRISRAQHTLEFPTDCMLVGSMNPCPCGYAGDPVKPCTCSPMAVDRYNRKLSGPIRDRFDMVIDVPRLSYETLQSRPPETSRQVGEKVLVARQAQRQRFGNAHQTNASMTVTDIERYCLVEDTAEHLLAEAVNRWHLSVRAYHRVLKMSRTIADLAGQQTISEKILSEALQYRQRDVATSA